MTRQEYNQLFEEQYSPLCNYAFMIVKDFDEAEDIVQGIFVNFWNTKKNEPLLEKATHYLVRSVKFKCIDFLRKLTTKRKYEKEALHVQEVTVQPEHEIAENVEIKDVLMMAIHKLPEKTQEVFMLCKLDGLSYKEIAAHLQISPKTVENQMGRAFKHLRAELADYKELLIFLFFIWTQ